MMSKDGPSQEIVQKAKVPVMAAQEIPAQVSQEGSYDSGRDSPLTSYPDVLTIAEVEDLAGRIFKQRTEKRTSLLYTDSQGPGQPVHPYTLIRTYAVHLKNQSVLKTTS